MNRPTSDLDLSKDFIIVDMSNVPELIKDAMNVLVTGLLHSRFNIDNDRDTIIAMDEAGVYLRTPKLASDMLTTLTQGRSRGVFLGLCTHQPSDFTKNGMREEFQTKDSSQNNLCTAFLSRFESVVPFSVKLITNNTQFFNLLFRYFNPFWIFILI